ncbi:PHP domain-containing protein [Oceanirhabdus sp. W0125-5]|uniref:PHP domain-containing protein n=1 Tax=Oceanirhabdus sp. W0125-5 TaxID=2999116 RepID=UPI0022F336F2|nr:PHP domain-containing protein [Oceanirhabdus sp. W0125-5]WBW95749.1 PHP domain-containing protein [Oceanirhabdus sp. W0125-5]
MEIFVDLHIHSDLSPCGDELMTPSNILNMAYLKGLDAIAITDHNIGMNIEAAWNLSKERGIILIPGMELQTKEEFHSICLFRDMESFNKFQEFVLSRLPKIKNNAEVFGRQHLYNNDDEIVGEYPLMLLNSVNVSIDEAFMEVESLGGVLIPAHVDRDCYSIINSLGFIPETLDIKTIEVANLDKFNKTIKLFINKEYNVIQSSDAHKLEDIFERKFKIEVCERSLNGIIDSLKGITNNVKVGE